MSFELPKLGYAYDALEPTIDAQTMEIHYTKHHQAYVDNLNKAIAGTDLEGKTIEEVIKEGSDKPAVRNNGGGHFNHTLFWEILTPGGSKEPVGKIKEAIENYGGLEKFKTDFAEAAKTRFGSGWAWLIKMQTDLYLLDQLLIRTVQSLRELALQVHLYWVLMYGSMLTT